MSQSGKYLITLNGAEVTQCGGLAAKANQGHGLWGHRVGRRAPEMWGWWGADVQDTYRFSYLICIPGLTFNFICIHYSQWELEWFLKQHKVHLNYNGKNHVRCDALITVKLTLGYGKCQFSLAT